MSSGLRSDAELRWLGTERGRAPLLGPAIALVFGLVASPLVARTQAWLILAVVGGGIAVYQRSGRGSLLWPLLVFLLLGLARGLPSPNSMGPPVGSLQVWEVEVLRSMGPPVNARWSAHAQVAHAPGPRVDRSTPRWIGKAPVQVHLPTWSHVASSPRRGERWMFRGRLREAQHGPRWRAPVLRVASVEHGVRLRGVESFADHCLQLSDRAFSGLGRRARRAIEFGSP
ncbi:MAG TPA: hypothetical protein DIU15_15470, partial [Deltaproteobacteria bacterium]|nr:hypothetical protein [Deltaproteobacteria bacterium]